MTDINDLQKHVQARVLEIQELTNRMPFATNAERDKFITFLGAKYFTQSVEEAWVDELKSQNTIQQ